MASTDKPASSQVSGDSAHAAQAPTALYWPARNMGKPLIDIDDKEALGRMLDQEYLDRLDQ
jgi:hypothetical protein